MTGLAILATLLVIAPLVAIFVYLIYKGASSLNLAFFTQNPEARGRIGRRHGKRNCRLRRFCLEIASAIGVPIGIGGGIYLAEFGRGTKLANAIRFTADVLNGVPSIVMGMAVYSLIVIPQGHFSALFRRRGAGHHDDSDGGAHDRRDAADGSERDARGGAGTGRAELASVLSITVKTASPGIITGCMLAFARVAGETAPLIFTALRQFILEHRV